jgi:hypothetical protein
MAFNISAYVRLISDAGERTNKCFYKTTDALATVLGAGYFNNVAPDSLIVGDIIECAIDTDGTLSHETLVVSAVTSGVVTVAILDEIAYELTATGAVPSGAKSVELNHATVVIEATIADASNHQGLFIAKDTSASGTAAHTVTLTSGTWDGTNNTITLDAPEELLAVWFDSAGNGTVIENVGTVVLSTV